LQKIEKAISEIEYKREEMHMVLTGKFFLQTDFYDKVYERHQEKNEGLRIVFDPEDFDYQTRIIQQDLRVQNDAGD